MQTSEKKQRTINPKSYVYAYTQIMAAHRTRTRECDNICIYANERNLNMCVFAYGTLISAQMHTFGFDGKSVWEQWWPISETYETMSKQMHRKSASHQKTDFT